MTLASDRDRRRISICIAASMMLHAGALAFLPLPFGGSFPTETTTPMEIRFRALAALTPTAETEPATRGEQKNRRAAPATRNPGTDTKSEADEARSPSIAEMEPEASSPAVNLEASRAVARELGRQKYGFTESSPFDTAHSNAQMLARGIAQSTPADCRTAYSGMGPLAIPFLIVAALTDRGCKW